jgi:hypothetical protein
MTVNEAIRALEAIRDEFDAGDLLVLVVEPDFVSEFSMGYHDPQIFGPPVIFIRDVGPLADGTKAVLVR